MNLIIICPLPTNLLGEDSQFLLDHTSNTIKKETLHLPGPDFVDRVMASTDRNNNVLRNLQSVFDHGRLGKTGYVSILPVDQGIEHSAGASFAPNPIYFDPENIVKLAIEGGCNAVASTLGVLGSVSRKPRVYSELTTDHPVDLTRYQVANCYMGRIGLYDFITSDTFI